MTTRLPLPPSWPPMTKTVYKPWLDDRDADNVFFGSVSLQDKDLFYPASGDKTKQEGALPCFFFFCIFYDVFGVPRVEYS